jgi:hypothetical protein
MAKTHYQKLQAAKVKLCNGKINATDFNKVATIYKQDAIKKATTRLQVPRRSLSG